MVKKMLLILAVVIGILTMPGHGNAALVFEYNTTAFSGTSPIGSAPWLTATFANTGTNEVTLTVGANLGSQFISELVFNFGPNTESLPPITLTITGTWSNVTISPISYNAYRPDGDGFYDIQLSFPTGPPTGRFDNNDTTTFTITGTGITESYFNYLSGPAPGGGPGPFYTAVHVQNIGASRASGWVAGVPEYGVVVPIPAAAWLLGSGLVGLVVIRRRMKK